MKYYYIMYRTEKFWTAHCPDFPFIRVTTSTTPPSAIRHKLVARIKEEMKLKGFTAPTTPSTIDQVILSFVKNRNSCRSVTDLRVGIIDIKS